MHLQHTTHSTAMPSCTRSIHGITANSSAVLLAATGKGSAHLEAQPVLQGPAWSTAAVVTSRTGNSATIASDTDADRLPRDWQQLAKLAQLRSFMALPIATGEKQQQQLTVSLSPPSSASATLEHMPLCIHLACFLSRCMYVCSPQPGS